MHNFSQTAMLLVKFPKLPQKSGKILDLCAGNGAVGLFASTKSPPKKIQFLHPKAGKEANALLIEGIKNGSKERFKILPLLIIHTQTGDYTQKIKEIYYMEINKHYFYVLLTNDNTYYAGYTTEPERRLAEHNNGVGAKYTRLKKRRPVKMIHLEVFTSRNEATAAEAVFKKLTREQKTAYLTTHKS